MGKERKKIGTDVFILQADKEFGFHIPKLVGIGIITASISERNNHCFNYLYMVKDSDGNIYEGHYDPFYDKSDIFFRDIDKQIEKTKDYLEKLSYILDEEEERLNRLYSLLNIEKVDKCRIDRRISQQIKVIKSLNARKEEVQKRLVEYLIA